MNPITRRQLMHAGLAGVGAAAVGGVAPAATAAPVEFSFHRDHVIGTSFDLWVTAPGEVAAETAEQAALDEIERLRAVFSTHDPDSEVSRLNRTTGPVPASAELREVLRAYEAWERACGGAFNGRVGELVRVWQYAEKANRLPDAAELDRIARDLQHPGWRVDGDSVTRLTDQPLNLNSIAKGYILRRAAAAVRTAAPGSSGLLNLGGDMVAWGEPAAVAVQDPFNPAGNVRPLGGVLLADAAVATSGGYQRFYAVNGERYSHLFDPRTGRPAGHVASATVIAPESVTANALATALCVLTPAEGLALAVASGAECLIVGADGTHVRSPGFGLIPVAPTREVPIAAPLADGWPEGFQVTVSVELPKIDAKRYRRPYVAVWVEDADKKPVRTLTVWGNSPKYFKDLTDWWRFARGDGDLIKAVTRATRGPGKYDVVWDGKTDKGTPVPQGTYTVRVEVHREFGEHLRQSGKIDCKADPAKATLAKNAETGDTVIEFARKK